MLDKLFGNDVDKLNRLVNIMPDTQSDTLEYWESGGNPYVDSNLSIKDLAKIGLWMKISETMPGKGWIRDLDPTLSLSDRDRTLVNFWMIKTESLPTNYNPDLTLYNRVVKSVVGSYDRLCTARYNYNLQVLTGERDPWRLLFVPRFVTKLFKE